MIAGLARPDAGHVKIHGKALFDSDNRIHMPPQKRRIGYVFQDARLFPHISVKKNLMYGMHHVPERERYVDIDQVVSLLGIGHLLDRRPEKLSGGEKQRVAIGRALLTSPSLLLMDEPLSSLDQLRKKEVLPFIRRLSKEFDVPIIYVSHALDEVLNLADYLVLMKNGTVAASGDIDDILRCPELSAHLGGSEYGTIISAVIETAEDGYGLSHLRFSNGVIKVPRLGLAENSPVRIRIPARSVSLCLTRPQATSIQNIFPGVVEEINESREALLDLRINIGVTLMSRITKLSGKTLGLVPGKKVYAMVKSISVAHGPINGENAEEGDMVV